MRVLLVSTVVFIWRVVVMHLQRSVLYCTVQTCKCIFQIHIWTDGRMDVWKCVYICLQMRFHLFNKYIFITCLHVCLLLALLHRDKDSRSVEYIDRIVAIAYFDCIMLILPYTSCPNPFDFSCFYSNVFLSIIFLIITGNASKILIDSRKEDVWHRPYSTPWLVSTNMRK